MLPAIRSSSEIYGDDVDAARASPSPASSATSRRPSFGQACLAPGEAKNTYGTGCFMLMNTGEKPFPSSSGLLTTLGYKLGDAKPVYRAGRLDRDHRRAGAMAARQSRHDRDERRGRDARHAVSRTMATSIRAGLLRPLRAVLEGKRARRDHGPHALRQPGAYRPRRARGDRLSDARCARRDGQGFQGRNSRIALRWRHGGQRAPDAVPGRHSRRAGGAPESHRDDGARRRLCGWPRDWLLEEHATTSGAIGASTSAGSPAMAGSERSRLYASWKKAVSRSLDWAR